MKEKLDRSSPLYKTYTFYRDIQIAIVPLILMAVYFYGLRPLVVVLLAVGTALICDWVAAKLLGKKVDRMDNSSVTAAMIFAMMLPASIDYYIVFFGVVVMILIAKHAFGGMGVYPFNPAAVGYAVVAVSWPEQLFLYPQPLQQLPLFSVEGVKMAEAASHVLKLGGLPHINTLDLIVGNFAGPMGTTFSLVMLACFLFLVIRGHQFWRMAISFIFTAALITFLFPRVFLAGRFDVMRYEILSGSFFFASIFLLIEPTTAPKNKISQIIYGALFGFLTIMFHYFGTFEFGVCFALIIVNSISGYIDRMVLKLTQKKQQEVRVNESE